MSACRPGRMRGPRMTTPFVLLLLLTSLAGTVLCQYEDDGADVDAAIEEEETGDPDPEGGDDAPTTESPPIDPDVTSPTDLVLTDDVVDETVEESHDPELGYSIPPEEDSSIPPEEDNPFTPEDDNPFTPEDNYSINPEDLLEMTENPELLNSTSLPEDGEDEALSPIIIMIPVVLVVVIVGMTVGGIFINRRWNEQARKQELRKQDSYLDGSSTEKVPMPMFEEDVPSVLELEMEELDQWMQKDGETAAESIPA